MWQMFVLLILVSVIQFFTFMHVVTNGYTADVFGFLLLGDLIFTLTYSQNDITWLWVFCGYVFIVYSLLLIKRNVYG